MNKKLIKVLPYIIGGASGIVIGCIGIEMRNIKELIMTIILLIPILILQLIVFVISHELSHGFVGKKYGLKFTVLYLGPFVFKRENKKFKKIKGIFKQSIFIGRAQIDNFEILNEKDIDRGRQAWIKALQAGPLSDLILSIIVILIGIISKSYLLIISTIIISGVISIPSYFMGDGKHIKMLKNDKVFTDVILYTYSIAGNTPISQESRAFIVDRMFKDIEENKVNEMNLISMVLAAHSIYIESILKLQMDLPEEINSIVNMCIENKNIFLKKQIEQSYYKSLINAAILYEVLINENKEKALDLYNHVKNEKHNMPGEMLDFYRVQHVLGINNRKGEILNKNLMNPMFKGCQGINDIEERINNLILSKSKIM